MGRPPACVTPALHLPLLLLYTLYTPLPVIGRKYDLLFKWIAVDAVLTLVAVLLFFLLFSFLLLFRSVFVFVFLSKLPTSTTPREFTFSQRTRLVPRCVYVLHCLLVYMYVPCVCIRVYVLVSLVFNIFVALCFGSLIISLSRSLAIFALKKPNTFCVLFCYYYLCVCVYLEDWLTVANYIYWVCTL